MNGPVVITALGTVSPPGVGWEVLQQALLTGTLELSGEPRGAVRGLDPASLLGPRGLRLLDRHARLTLSAARLALDDGQVDLDILDPARLGVVLGSAMGSLSSRAEFSLQERQMGFVGVNPAFFPNTVANSSASQVAIRFGLRGPNETVATGLTSGLVAVQVAAETIAGGHADLVLAGGTEELSVMQRAALQAVRFLSPDGRTAPLDRRRNGVVLGEGSALMLLETAAGARARGRRIRAVIRGAAAAGDPDARGRYSPRATGLTRAIQLALARAGLVGDDIDLVVCGANGSPAGDLSEARGLRRGLGRDRVRVTAPKATLGESCSAGSAFQVATAVLCLESGVIPPVVGMEELDRRARVDCERTTRRQPLEHVLVTSQSPTGHAAALVLAREGEEHAAF